MKISILIIVLLMTGGMIPCMGQGSDSLLVMFWNMENFFDYRDTGKGDSDHEFSSYGSRHWTKKRFQAKCNAFAKTVYHISDICGRMPDVIGLAEIENRNVLYSILHNTALKKSDYSIIHYEGRDRRGIDVAMLYRSSIMTPESISRKVPIYQGDTLLTRDILHAHMNIEDGSSIDFIVNHHPSKYGGETASEGRRMAAMLCLKELCDSIGHLRRGTVVAMGDFNDTPDSVPFKKLDGCLVNKGSKIHEKGQGSIRYEGKWELIDMFLLSPEIAQKTNMQIMKLPFLMIRDSKHSGEKPFRTYSGPRYIGGVSDHCPIVLYVYHL